MSDKPAASADHRAARGRSEPLHAGDQAAPSGRLVIECPACHTSIAVEEPAVRAFGAGRAPVVLRLRGPMPSPEVPLDMVVRHLEGELARRALRQTGGVKLHAAELLGMKYSTLWDRLRRLGVDAEGGASGGDVDEDGELPLERVTRVDVELASGGAETLDLRISIPEGGGLLPAAVRGLRTELARHALNQCNDNFRCAAERLGMKYTTFHSLVRRLGIRD